MNVLACVLAAGMAASSHAGTIIKLGLGQDAAFDVQFQGGALSTVDDGDGATDGDQNTRVDFLGFLSGETDILTPDASFTLDGLSPSGSPVVFGSVLLQQFSGGMLALYGSSPDNDVLLEGTLAGSVLSGAIGLPATGALFTTTFATVTGGSLKPQIKADSLTLSMSLTDVNGGSGLSISGGASPVLNPFAADVTLNIAAEPVPEPATAMLTLVGGLVIAVAGLRRRTGGF